jgi:hypothetical protein
MIDNQDDKYNKDFNELFQRPPNFCEECGSLLNFEIIEEGLIFCQKCGGTISVDNIIHHEIVTNDYYTNSHEWMNKLTNKEDKLKKKEKVKKSKVIIKFVINLDKTTLCKM